MMHPYSTSRSLRSRRLRGFLPVGAALLAGLLLVGCFDAHSQTSDGTPVAEVAGVTITQDDFADRYAAYLLKTGQTDAPRLRLGFLRHLADIQLIVRAERDAGADATDAYAERAEALRRKLLLDAYTERTLADEVTVTEADLRDQFVRMSTRLRARHLYARTRAEADRLHARLQAGETFETLAQEVFADTLLAHNGGALGTFGFDEMDPAFEEVAYHLPVGALSEPVRTAFGYSIIRVDERLPDPVMTEAEFAERRSQVRTFVERRERQLALAAHGEALAEALAITLDAAASERLLAQVQGLALADEDAEAEAWLDAPLVRFTQEGARRTWTVRDVRDHARYTDPEQRAQVTSAAHLESFITGLVVRAEMLRRAEAAGLDADPRFAPALRRALDVYLHGEAVARFEAETVVPDDTVAAYFEANAARYTLPRQVHVREILVDTKADADRLRAALDTTAFATLARLHSLRPGADATGGDLGFVTRDQLGRLADPVFSADLGSVLGPLEVAGRYVLLQVEGERSARPATLAEVRGDIEAHLREGLARAGFRTYVADLNDRYEVVLHPDAALAVALPPALSL